MTNQAPLDYSNPFELLKTFPGNNNTNLDNIDSNVFSQHYFILNRIISRNDPLMCDFFNINGIDTGESLRIIAKIIRRRYDRAPSAYFYKAKAIKEEEKIKISEDTLKCYARLKDITLKELHEKINFFPDIVEEILKYESTVLDKPKKKTKNK